MQRSRASWAKCKGTYGLVAAMALERHDRVRYLASCQWPATVGSRSMGFIPPLTSSVSFSGTSRSFDNSPCTWSSFSSLICSRSLTFAPLGPRSRDHKRPPSHRRCQYAVLRSLGNARRGARATHDRDKPRQRCAVLRHTAGQLDRRPPGLPPCVAACPEGVITETLERQTDGAGCILSFSAGLLRRLLGHNTRTAARVPAGMLRVTPRRPGSRTRTARREAGRPRRGGTGAGVYETGASGATSEATCPQLGQQG